MTSMDFNGRESEERSNLAPGRRVFGNVNRKAFSLGLDQNVFSAFALHFMKD